MNTSPWRLFSRSFLVQGSFNYRGLLGSGFAWLLLPGLEERDQEEEGLRRHSEPFNGHPYLIGLAAGAVERLEAEGAEEEKIRRFKEAIRGPLGGVGDRLVWSALRPTLLLLALLLWALDVHPWIVVGSFLILYNIVHLRLRWWSARAGLEEGLEVGARLRRAGLGRWADRIIVVGTVLLGLLAGVLVSGLLTLGGLPGWGWSVLALAAFVVGVREGDRAPRPTGRLLFGAVGVLAIIGLL